jgi:cell division septation protein DedD
MLRLKGEPDHELHEQDPLPAPSDRITGSDVFPDDEPELVEDEPDESVGRIRPSMPPGPVIAAATFVPTFLAVFFGLTYMLGAAGPTARSADSSTPPAGRLMSDVRGQRTPSLSEALRDPFAAPPLLDPPATDTPTARPVDPGNENRVATRQRDPRESSREESGRGSGAEDPTRSAIESSGPSLPPPRMSTPASPGPRAARPAEAPRQPQAAVLTTPPDPPRTAEARKTGSGDWTPAAAFADREAAGRLASSIQKQGYPVEVRQDRGAARPWVVWIGAQPRGGERRR